MDTLVVFPSRPDPARYGLTPERIRYFQPKTEHFDAIFFTTIALVLGGIFFVNQQAAGPQPLAALFFVGVIAAAIALSGRINKVIVATNMRSRAQQPDHQQFLRYEAAVAEFNRLNAE